MVLLLCLSGIFSGNDEYTFERASTLALGAEKREEESCGPREYNGMKHETYANLK